MRNPNFLILDEPTNDLDIVTLQILEDYLTKFKGCLIVVSHDRYFMDKVVDHILVFHGEGRIQDFPGSYSLYRAAEDKKQSDTTLQNTKKKEDTTTAAATTRQRPAEKRRLSFKEKREFEQLTADIDALEAEKKKIEDGLSSGCLDTDTIIKHSKRLPLLTDWMNILAKVTYDCNFSQYDPLVPVLGEYWSYGGGFEFFPRPDNKELRIHALYYYFRQPTLSLGLTWKIHLLKR